MSKKKKLVLFIVLLFIFIFLYFIYDKLFLQLTSMDIEGKRVEVKFYRKNYSRYSNKIKISTKDSIKEQNYIGHKKLNIWKATSKDIDGDSIEELVLGVYKKSPHHKIMAKRIFIYNIKDLSLKAKYRASRLSLPFEDFAVFDLDGDGVGEIISIELKDNKKIIAAYKYNNFKLRRTYLSDYYKNIENIEAGNKLSLEVDGSRKDLMLENGKVVLK